MSLEGSDVPHVLECLVLHPHCLFQTLSFFHPPYSPLPSTTWYLCSSFSVVRSFHLEISHQFSKTCIVVHILFIYRVCPSFFKCYFVPQAFLFTKIKQICSYIVSWCGKLLHTVHQYILPFCVFIISPRVAKVLYCIVLSACDYLFSTRLKRQEVVRASFGVSISHSFVSLHMWRLPTWLLAPLHPHLTISEPQGADPLIWLLLQL